MRSRLFASKLLSFLPRLVSLGLVGLMLILVLATILGLRVVSNTTANRSLLMCTMAALRMVSRLHLVLVIIVVLRVLVVGLLVRLLVRKLVRLVDMVLVIVVVVLGVSIFVFVILRIVVHRRRRHRHQRWGRSHLRRPGLGAQTPCVCLSEWHHRADTRSAALLLIQVLAPIDRLAPEPAGRGQAVVVELVKFHPLLLALAPNEQTGQDGAYTAHDTGTGTDDGT